MGIQHFVIQNSFIQYTALVGVERWHACGITNKHTLRGLLVSPRSSPANTNKGAGAREDDARPLDRERIVPFVR